MRTHCFISTTQSRGLGTRWAWHTADHNGVSRNHSETDFTDFNACVDDARAHGFHHIEVPLLHWSAAAAGESPAAPAADVAPPAAAADLQ